MQDSVWSYRTTGVGGPNNFGAQQFVLLEYSYTSAYACSIGYRERNVASPARVRRPTKKFDRQLGQCEQHVKRRQIANLRR